MSLRAPPRTFPLLGEKTGIVALESISDVHSENYTDAQGQRTTIHFQESHVTQTMKFPSLEISSCI